MSANAKLVVHCGGIRRTREELATLETPQGTRTWRPVPHADLVGELINGLEARGITVAGEEYATMGRGDAKLFGVLRLSEPGFDTHEYRLALGLKAANDRTMSIQIVSGVNVFVCDNLAFKGDGAVVLKKRHTSRLRLAAILPGAIDAFLSKAEAFKGEIQRMQDHSLTDDEAKGIIHDAFAGPRPVMPLRHFPTVSRLYFEDAEQWARFPSRDLWSLSQAFTEALKPMRPAPQQQCGLRIGRLFGKVVDLGSREPIGVVDGIEVFN